MNRLIVAILVSVCVVGCQSKEEQEKIALKKRQSALTEKCIDTLRLNLKDPDSMKITVSPSVFVHKGVETVGFLYNAKNSYGGYAGDESFYCEFDSSGNITDSR